MTVTGYALSEPRAGAMQRGAVTRMLEDERWLALVLLLPTVLLLAVFIAYPFVIGVELSVTDAEAEIGYYQGDGILLEDVLREQVLLALPLKVTCREDCKGLCVHCGKNLNEGPCSCATVMEDPRWTALREIRSKLEH